MVRESTNEWTWKALESGTASGGREPTIRELAASYVEALLEDDPSQEFVLGGYSLGGNIAFEMAEQLLDRGRTVRHLLLIDSYAPEVYLADRDRGRFIEAFGMLASSVFPRLSGASVPAHATTVREVLDDMCQQMGEPLVRGHLLTEAEDFYRTWVAHHGALDRWFPDRELDVPVTLIHATGAAHPVMTHLSVRPDPEAWARHLRHQPHLLGVPGNHFSIVEDEACIRILAKTIDDVLSTIQNHEVVS